MTHSSVSISVNILVMVFQIDDEFGDCSALVAMSVLGLNGKYLSELVDFEVSRALLK